MGFFDIFNKPQRNENIEHIIRSFKILGTDVNGKSMFLDTGPIEARQTVTDFLVEHDIPVPFFRLCERVLLRTNLYIAAQVALRMRDENLRNETLKRLGDPREFIDDYEIEQTCKSNGMSADSIHGLMEYINYGYKLFTDGINYMNPKSHEQIADRFINYITHGACTKYDDMSLYLVVMTTITADMATLPEAIMKVQKELKVV